MISRFLEGAGMITGYNSLFFNNKVNDHP